MDRKKTYIIIGSIASIITIIVFVTGITNLEQILDLFRDKPKKQQHITNTNEDTGSYPPGKKETASQPAKKADPPPVEKEKHPSKPAVDKRKYSSFWDFDSGDLRGLITKNVQMKRSDLNNSLYVDFFNYRINSTLLVVKKVAAPWKLGFSMVFKNGIGGTIIEIVFSNDTSEFRFHIERSGFQPHFYFFENEELLFSGDLDEIVGKWSNWEIGVQRDGKLSIHIDKKPYFNYVFRIFDVSKPTEIIFKSPKEFDFKLDNLGLN